MKTKTFVDFLFQPLMVKLPTGHPYRFLFLKLSDTCVHGCNKLETSILSVFVKTIRCYVVSCQEEK